MLPLAAAALPQPNQARVYLRDGLVMRGEVELYDDHLVLTNSAGQALIRRESVRRIDWDTPATDVDVEYTRRAFVLDDADLAGHLRLAAWALDNRRPALAEQHCRAVLNRDPENEIALALLRRIAAVTTTAPGAPPAPADDAPPEPEPDPAPRAGRLAPPVPLSSVDVNRLKLYELDPFAISSDINVRFRRIRGTRDVEQIVLDELLRRGDADSGVLRQLERGQPHEKLQVILEYTGLAHADRIEIRGDPPVFETFRRRVLPEIVRGCARSGCHGGDVSYVFRLPAGSPTADRYAYTAFTILSTIETPIGPMIDREVPERSALLQYMLPAEAGPHPHPPLRVGRYLPPLRNTRDRRYGEIVRWIGSLRVPRAEYELEFEPPDWLVPLMKRPGPAPNGPPP